jgi:tungstate transport system substrate-binding protein
MHFASAKRYLAVVLIAAVGTVGVTAYLSLPRAYLLMATTTSTRDTGLLPYLLPLFTADSGIEVRYVAVGTGQALDAGRRGDVDVVMVHAHDREEAFLDSLDGRCRNMIMYNTFVIIGPTGDPAGVGRATSAADAFSRISLNQSLFESRADQSGTHDKELALWAAAGLNVSAFGRWYEKTNQGMGATLTIANEKSAYTLSDDGTWFARAASLPYLGLHYDRPDPDLRNQYSVIPVNPDAHPGVLAGQALAFARWLVGARAQSLIGSFEVNGHATFTPNAADNGSNPRACPP